MDRKKIDISLRELPDAPQKVPFYPVQNDAQAYTLNIRIFDGSGPGMTEVDYSQASSVRMVFAPWSKQGYYALRTTAQITPTGITYDMGMSDIPYPGPTLCAVQLMSAEGARITVARFMFDVAKDPAEAHELPNNPDIDILNQLTAQAQYVLDHPDEFKGADGRPIEMQATDTHLQWRYVGDAEWTNIIALSALQGPKGDDGRSFTIKDEYATYELLVAAHPTGEENDVYVVMTPERTMYLWGVDAGAWQPIGDIPGEDGADGREIVLRVTATYIQWQYVGDENWTNLMAVADLVGPNKVTASTKTTLNGLLKGTAQDLQEGNITAAAPGEDYALPADRFIAELTTIWSGSTAPYTQQADVEGMMATMQPIADVVFSGDLETQKAQEKAFAKISKFDTQDGAVVFTCFDDKPTIPLTIQLKEAH